MPKSMGDGEELQLVKHTANDDSGEKVGGDQNHEFKYRIGLILTCMGCTVGTGNIWRFPRIVAQNTQEKGGLVFVLVWATFTALWSIPMLYIEYAAGRYTNKSVIPTFRYFAGDKTIWCGCWVVVVSLAVACYYSVVLGWCFYYTYYTMTHDLPTSKRESTAVFNDFTLNGSWPVLTHALASTLAGLSVISGVKSIERISLVLVPTLLLIIILAFIWTLTRDFAGQGLAYLFSPDWASFADPQLWVDAISQNAFDTSAGQGLMLTYAIFMTRRNGVVKYGTFIPVCNNIISLTMAMMIFSTVFSTLLLANPMIGRPEIVAIIKDSGPASTGLTFIWLPVLFSSLGTFGRVAMVLFFFCVSFAGLTSMISYAELVVHTLKDLGLSRKPALAVGMSVIFLLGVPSALEINFLANQDYVWAFAMILCGLMFQVMVMVYGVRRYRNEVINDYGTNDWKLPRFWEWIVKFVLPLEVLFLIVWWAVNSITSVTTAGEMWYEWGVETFLTTITEWFIVFVVLVGCNALLLYFRPKWFRPTEDHDVNGTTPSYTSYKSMDDSIAISEIKQLQ